MKQHKAADTGIFKMYQEDLTGTSPHVTIGRVSEEDRNRLIGSRLLDFFVLEKAKASKLSDNSIYPLYDDPNITIPTLASVNPGALARAGSHSASIRNLTGRVINGGEVTALSLLVDKLKATGNTYDKIGIGKFETQGGNVFADPDEYAQVSENLGKKVREIALKDNDYMMQAIIENITVAGLEARESKSIEEAAMGRFFSNIVADKFISDFRMTGNQAAIDGLRAGLLKDLNANNKAKVTSNPSDFARINGSGMIIADSSSLNPSFYTANDGTAVSSTDTRAVPDRVSERIMPGYSLVSLHEAVHGLDNFLSGIMGAMDQGVTLPFVQQREGNLGKRTMVRDVSDARFFQKNGIKLDPDIANIIANKIRARRGITGSAAKFAEEMITRNAAELDMYSQYSRHSPGNLVTKNNAIPILVDKFPSAGFFIPETNRLAYMLSSSRNIANAGEEPNLSNKFHNYSGNPIYDSDANPETATVGLEYGLGAPHILEASDEIFGTTYRRDINNYYGLSIVQKSDPILLANARVNMLAAKENPDSLYRGYIDKTVNDVRKYGMTPYQGKAMNPLERGLPIGSKVS